MVSKQSKQMAQFFASMTERMSRTDLDLATIRDVYVGEIMEFAKRAKDAGVDVDLHSVSEGQHNFILGAGRVPEVDEAIEQMGRWLRSRLSSVKGRAA